MEMKAKFKLNPDKELVKLINEGIKKYGGFCPCFLERENPDFKCPCKVYRETGVCVCMKFIE